MTNTGISKPVKGVRGYRERIQSLRGAFTDYEILSEDIIVQDDEFAVSYVWTGTQDGTFEGMMTVEPTGNKVKVKGIAFGRIEDGKLAEIDVVSDSLSLMRQLGAVEIPRSS